MSGAVDRRGLLDEEGEHYQPYAGPADEEPRKGCRDPVFAVVFLAHVAIVAYVAINYGSTALKQSAADSSTGSDDMGDPSATHNGHLLVLAFALAAAAVVASASWMTFMIARASDIIQCMLWTSVMANVAVGVLGLAVGEMVLAIFAFITALISWCYLRAVQPYIPFAAAQLRAATAAIKEFFNVIYVAYLALVVAFGWCVVWSLAIYGVMIYDQDHPEAYGGSQGQSGGDDDGASLNGLWYFLLLVSFYWSLQVLGGAVNTTVAGVVGNWWFIPKAEQQRVITGSLYRSLTTSFGSIAFGSLIVAVLETLKAIVEQARKQRDTVARCLVDCLISCLDSLARYFNRWAFTYVGIYGYSFVEAGSKVYSLFQRRGLTAVINDQLVSRVLFLGAVMIGLLMSGLGVLLGFVLGGTYLDGYSNPGALLAAVGFIAGLFVCNVIMNVVDAAVAAVLVCFLEDSAALQFTHPEYHTELSAAWKARFPDLNW